ncbi:MAG: hypothetical protein RL087_1261, partial [Pseudomonadota bacterium]
MSEPLLSSHKAGKAREARKVIPIQPVAAAQGAAAGAQDVEVSLYAAHQKVYPRTVSGLFSSWRWALVWLTQIVFYGLPWLEWGQRQAVLF